MADYMLLLRGGDEPKQAGEEISPAEMQAYLAPYHEWFDELTRRGQLRHAEQLLEAGAKVLRGQGKNVAVLDGPYTESKDVVGGYYLISAETEAEAVEIASRCPHLANGGTVELRRVAN